MANGGRSRIYVVQETMMEFFVIDIETFFFQLPIYNESKIFQKLENEYFREKKKENKEEGEIY